MLSERLRLTEVNDTQAVVEELASVPWARPLLSRLADAGGIQPDNMPLMFEARVAYELHRLGRTAEYEHPAGVGTSTVEFKLDGSPSWLMELVSVRKSDAMRHATTTSGIVTILKPDPKNWLNQSEAAETITAEHKIAEKVWSRGKPTKFPMPSGALHMIVIDIRGYLDGGGDKWDWRQIAYGASGCLPGAAGAIHRWQGQPVRGLFEQDNPTVGAQHVRQRIHFLGFVQERRYVPGEIRRIGYYCPNPYLFASQREVEAAFASYPLGCREEADVADGRSA